MTPADHLRDFLEPSRDASDKYRQAVARQIEAWYALDKLFEDMDRRAECQQP